MFKLKFLNRESAKELHQSYANEAIQYEEYEQKIKRLLYKKMISEKARTVLERMGIDLLDDKDKKLECDTETLKMLHHELNISFFALNELFQLVLDGQEKDNDFEHFSTRYRKITVVPESKWDNCYMTAKESVEDKKIDNRELLNIGVSTFVTGIKLNLCNISMEYEKLIEGGAKF